jgi:subtilisin family serine protease
MRQFAVALAICAVAVAASAQFVADSQFHIENADGSEVVFPAMAEATKGVIVEFVAPPASVAARAAGKTAIADYQATFARFRNDVGSILNANRSGKTAIEVPIRREYFVVFNGVALDVPPESIVQIRALPYVKRVVADRSVHTLADSANVSLIGAPKVWLALGTRGKGVTVAIIDTGIDYTHPALGGGFGPGFKVTGGWDFVNNDADPFDDNGHGTHVSGIVAGQSDTLTGVAPDVTLVAYKVLGANGGGSDSNVIAAIERAADPNGDGNTNDHVDVANLSLGGGGNPDDPTCVAIDNATAAGVTFAIAAGNNGVFHGIASPGNARSAITVGASDLNDRMTSFSSRGPNTKNMVIKPDVIAPGLSIVSSYPGNRYVSLSGTSMATPHVAGAAALLKSLHHDWTPAQIKLALMNNSTYVSDDIMAVGAGRIDVYAAATGNVVIDPPMVSLGLAPLDTNNWSASRTLHLTNHAAQPVTYAIRSNTAAGESVTLPSSVTVPAGSSADVTMTFAIDNVHTQAAANSFTGGGQIVLTNTGSLLDVRNIQFAFTKAARATVTFDRTYPDALWIDATHTNSLGATFVDDNTSEALMLPGTWDMLIYSPEFDAKTGIVTTVDFVDRDAVSLTGDSTIALTAADVPHTITLNGRRETGEALGTSGYASSGRILLGSTGITSLTFPWVGVPTLHVSDIAAQKKLLFYEALLDPITNSYYMIQHQALTGVSADMLLTTGGSSLRGGQVQIAVPSASLTDRRLTAQATTPTLSGGVKLTSIIDAPVVHARVYISPDVNPSYTYGIAFSPITDGATQYTTPLLRVSNDKLFSLGTGTLLPWAYSGSTFEFGLGPRFPASTFNATLTGVMSFTTEMNGPLGEVRVADRSGTTTTFFDSKGTKLNTAGFSGTYPLPGRLPFRIEVSNFGTLSPDVSKTTAISMAINASHADYLPPSLTTMMMLDGTGAIATRLDPHGSGSLLFSAADFGLNTTGLRVYQQIRGDATQVSYRYSGETIWRPLTATQVTEDSSSGAGILYRADLAAVAAVDRGLVDLKFDLADVTGNTTTVTMVPAFSIGPELPPKHRASR